MGNSLRCCLACVLPCGALDVIRIVHLNGNVEEMTRSVTASEVLGSYPNHVLSRPCSQGMVRKILILSPHSELKRGGIYFLIPDSSLPTNPSKTKSRVKRNKITKTTPITNNPNASSNNDNNSNNTDDNNTCVISDVECTTTLLNDTENVKVSSISECETKKVRHQRRRSSRGKSGIWHPHLNSITEDL